MAAQLHHTIVLAHDPLASATFLSDILGVPGPTRSGRFQVVTVDNGVNFDFAAVRPDDELAPQHYAFHVGDAEFDAAFRLIRDRGLAFWADPRQSRPGEVNESRGGRCIYFEDPSGHYLEIFTQP
jgi:catechol 2,3-dioxygenase-like lactoylglutathione lyase family enzyme